MAEKKYDLTTLKSSDSKLIQHQPWYKERIHTKYIKSLKPWETCFKNLDGRKWQFIKDGLDDCRDGHPPFTHGKDIIPPISRGIEPGLTNVFRTNYVKQRATEKGRFTKEQVYLSSIIPQTEQKIDYINEIEGGLFQHPLALFPHLEQSVTPEVFQRIVAILDPQLNMIRMDSGDLNSSPSMSPATSKTASRSENKQLSSLGSSGISPGAEIRNPYYWLPKPEAAMTAVQKKVRERREIAKAQENHIRGVAKEFCDWVLSLGGDANNIEEATIASLFASGYETKPALSIPIRVVDLANVPLELRISAAVEPLYQGLDHVDNMALIEDKSSEHLPKKWIKFRYGAWYLPPSSWRKRNVNEDLRDPKELKDELVKQNEKNSEKLNHELAQIHGTDAFMNFVEGKGKSVRHPLFLSELREIQTQMAEEEQRKKEEEQAAKLKRFPNIKNQFIV